MHLNNHYRPKHIFFFFRTNVLDDQKLIKVTLHQNPSPINITINFFFLTALRCSLWNRHRHQTFKLLCVPVFRNTGNNVSPWSVVLLFTFVVCNLFGHYGVMFLSRFVVVWKLLITGVRKSKEQKVSQLFFIFFFFNLISVWILRVISYFHLTYTSFRLHSCVCSGLFLCPQTSVSVLCGKQ